MLGYGHPMLLEPNMNTSRQTSQQLLGNVWQSLRKKDIKQAINTSNLLVQKHPDFAAGWHAASHVAQAVRRPGAALIAIERALSLEPANIDWQLHQASCLLVCGNNENSARLLHKMVAACDGFSAEQLSQLAFLCSRIECHDEASQIYLKLITLEPNNGGHWYNLASIQRFKGQVEQAEASLDKAIELNQGDYDAFQLRSDLRIQTSVSNHITQLHGLLKKGIDLPAGEVQICYALAKELEDTGDSQESFEVLSRGATLRRKHINYKAEDDLNTIDTIMDTFGSAVLATPSEGIPTREPVFVIGLPRTGTTLVERILGSHPEVFAAGELNNFALQMMLQVRQQPNAQKWSRKELVQQTAKLDFNDLGQAYLESTRPLTGHTAHFVDKMPLNFLYAGLIHRAMPNAKIVHLSRHPMDTCYSIYKCLFQDAYPWSYDLGEIALYYSAYHQLMTHWNTVMPGVIHELAYEDLVGDVEGQARKLLDYCELTWDSRCVRFHESLSTSTTASATQVRQPVYQSSVNRWKSYKQQLSPLRERLGNLGIDVD
jgi:tetratricopeptide (TPR) repeat protein